MICMEQAEHDPDSEGLRQNGMGTAPISGRWI